MSQEETRGRLRVAVGNVAFPPGRTEVTLEPSGRLLVTSELEGSESRREELKVDSEDARAMFTTASNSVAAARSSDRPGLPDEPRYHFDFGEGQGVDIWRSDLEEHPELGRLVREMQRTIDEQARVEILL